MKRFFLLICLFCSFLSYSQNQYQVGFLPNVNFSKKFKEPWKLNVKAESRQRFSSGDFGGVTNTQYDYLLTDISTVVSRKVGINNSLASGYLMRFREKKIIHRLIQQFTLTGKLNGFRLAHRFTADQTFAKDEDAEFRFRYRITPEIPLNGLSVDPKEFYIKINNEYLNSFQGSVYDIEVRLIPLLGYELSGKNKIEGGLDYRMGSILNDRVRHSFWFTINWYVAL